MQQLVDLIKFSHQLGSQIDLVQGGGGNTSVKDAGQLFIKASGTTLQEMSSENIAVVDISTKQPLPNSPGRPSMETGMHLALPTYVFHTHAVDLNVWLCAKLSKEEIARLFNEFKPLVLDYVMPGEPLSQAIRANWQPEYTTIFLLNHGLITVGETAQAAADLHLAVVEAAYQLVLKKMPSYQKFTGAEPKKLPTEFLFPDAAVFGDELESLGAGQQQIIAAHEHIIGTIQALGLRPRYLLDEDVAALRGLDAEKYRRTIKR